MFVIARAMQRFAYQQIDRFGQFDIAFHCFIKLSQILIESFSTSSSRFDLGRAFLCLRSGSQVFTDDLIPTASRAIEVPPVSSVNPSHLLSAVWCKVVCVEHRHRRKRLYPPAIVPSISVTCRKVIWREANLHGHAIDVQDLRIGEKIRTGSLYRWGFRANPGFASQFARRNRDWNRLASKHHRSSEPYRFGENWIEVSSPEDENVASELERSRAELHFNRIDCETWQIFKLAAEGFAHAERNEPSRTLRTVVPRRHPSHVVTAQISTGCRTSIFFASPSVGKLAVGSAPQRPHASCRRDSGGHAHGILCIPEPARMDERSR